MRRPRGLFKARGGRHRVGLFVPSTSTWHRVLDAARRRSKDGEVWRVEHASVRDLKSGGAEGWYIESVCDRPRDGLEVPPQKRAAAIARPRGLFQVEGGGTHRTGYYAPRSRTWHGGIASARRAARGGPVWRVYRAAHKGWYIEYAVPPEPGAVSGL